MKQVLQSLKSGKTQVADIPCPSVQRGSVLIRSTCTLISPGTERMLVDFGKASFIGKARQQPDRVKQVLEKMLTDGLKPSLEAVFNKLDQPLPLGYCNVGRVMEAGVGVERLSSGDRVVSNGKHAEVVCVPKNLCAKIPKTVSDEEASFTVLGAIALQGIRLATPALGETFVVMGLGLVGLLTVQLLKANGCRVIGLDFDKNKLELARNYGAETVDLSAGIEPIAAAMSFSRDRGVDGVLITAATRSSEPVHQAASMCRKRGRIVLVGVTGLALSRADFYEKELTFQVSCSYGPGRYDPNYEEGGQDYPFGFVRWTEQRNLEAVLDMMASKRLDVGSLVSHRFAIEEAELAYELVCKEDSKSTLGIVLTFSEQDTRSDVELRQQTVKLLPKSTSGGNDGVRVGFVGAGNYASAMLIPAFGAAGATLDTVVSNGGISGAHAGKKHGFAKTTTDADEVIADPALNALVVATRHDSHCALAVKAIDAGKHVFVEKPLAISHAQLAELEQTYSVALSNGVAPLVMVGFNRRFAPQVLKIKDLLSKDDSPKSITMSVNAGAIPSSHWTQSSETGGGRIIGEACHFIDLVRHVAGAPITGHAIKYMDSENADTASISLQFADGSIGTVHYFANGPKSLPKERLEIFSSGRVLQLDNFRKLRGYGWPGFRKMNLWQQDKGQRGCAAAFVEAIKNGKPSPISFEELVEVSRVTIQLAGRH